MKPLTTGSLFSGIGAFERALERININHELKYYCEIDKYASKSYSAIHNIDESLNLGDITKVDIDSLPYVDLITHGSPCQDFSVAGKQKGGDKGTNTRSSLMWNTVEIIKHTKPKYVIWENVKNVLSDKHIHNFKKYKKILRELGYKNYFKVINAKHWGIPQNRERIFIVSIRKDIDNGFSFPISSLEGQQSLFNKNVIDIESKVLRDVLETNVDEKYYIDDDKVKELLKELNAKEIGINPCITSDRLNKRQKAVVRNEDKWRIKNDGVTNCLDANYGKGIDYHGARTGVLELNKIGNIYPSNGQNGEIYNSDGVSPSLRSGQGVKGRGIGSCNSPKILTQYRIRKLTPLECWKLMGFDDKDYWKARNKLEDKYYNGADRSDSQCYKMAGNSIVVNVLEYIFRELFKDRLPIKGVD